MGNRLGLRIFLICAGVFAAPAPLAGQYSPTRLSSGVAVATVLGPVTTGTLFTGDYSLVIAVPANASRLDITLSTEPATADADLFVRRGQDVALVNQQVVFDQSSTGATGTEAISIPAPQVGDYYIALAIRTTGIQVTCTVKATVTPGVNSEAPVLPAAGVLNAGDNTPNFAPGTILSLYGTNLAQGTRSGSLPLPTALLGTSVEVQVNGRAYAAPLFFVSAGQINAQLPYEATGNGVQIRVKTAAGASDWVSINVAARAPRVLTVNMAGNGAPILQHHADYKLVSADYPAMAGEVVTLYLVGLGATSPATVSGAAAGDGSPGKPLNTVADVSVKVGNETAEVFFAGLTPYLVGLYQVDFRVPPGAVAGTLPVTITVAQATSQANVTASCGEKEAQLLNTVNTAACGTTGTSSFTLDREAFITRFSTWYRWDANETTVGFTLRKSGQQVLQGNFQRSGCDPSQTSWCAGEVAVNQWWTSGQYDLTVNQPRVCANSGSANQGFVTVFGAWKAGGAVPIVSSTIGPSGGSVTNAGMTASVAPGAFDQPTVLNLSQVSDATPPAGGRISEIYRLEPLPGTVAAPITLTLQPVGTLPGTGKTLVFVKFEGEDDRGPMVLPATIQDGKIVATLPAMPPGSVAPAAEAKASETHAAVVDPGRVASLIWALGGVGEEASLSGKFLVHYPTGDNADHDLALKVGDTMDEARAKLQATGIEVDRRTTPIDVYLYSFTGVQGRILMADPKTNGESESELWGKQGVGLTLNLDQIKGAANWENARTTAAHEMFHIYQSLYDPRGTWRRTLSNSPWLWMLEAASTWFEKKMVSGSNYLSPNAKAYSDFLYLHGLEYPPGLLDKVTVSRHGYGASLFLDYMTGQKGDKLIGELIKDMQPSTGIVFKASLYSPVEALGRQEILLGYKWQVFVKELADGKVNPGILIDTMVSPPSATLESYTNSADSSTGTKFQWAAPDLAARGYKVTFQRRTTQWPAGTKLTFLFSGPANDAQAYLYKSVTGKGWVYQASFTSTYEVADADQLAQNGALFFVLVANGHAQRPFTGTTPIALEVRVDVTPTGGYPAGLEGGLVTIANYAGAVTYSCSDYDSGSYHTQTLKKDLVASISSTDLLGYPGYPIKWSGRTFTLDATKQSGTNTRTLKFNGQVDATGANLITWSVDYTDVTIGTNTRSDYHIEFTLHDIPLPHAPAPSRDSGWQYELQNTPMSGHLTGLKYSSTSAVQGYQPEGCTMTAVDLASTSWAVTAYFH
jgi:uncharacterized protein (TIGR03437 family)